MAIRVLVVDDSAVMRSVLSEIINQAPDLEVVGTATDPIVAREMIKQVNPDVVTLDIEMPKMDGLEFLDKLMRLRPTPVITPALGASLSYMPYAASCESSRNGEPGSSRVRTRSRGRSLPRATCFARAASPPPWETSATLPRRSWTSDSIAVWLARNSAERALMLVRRMAISGAEACHRSGAGNSSSPDSHGPSCL